MTNQMCWLPKFGSGDGDKILHLRTDANAGWRPYTAFPQFSVPDYRIPRGSKGWATYQKLRQAGWTLVASNGETPAETQETETSDNPYERIAKEIQVQFSPTS